MQTNYFTYGLIIVINSTCVLFYLYFSSLTWLPAQIEWGFGEGLSWTLTALPWLAVCSVINFILFRTVCARFFLYRRWQPLLTLGIFIALWIAAIALDFSHH